VKEIRIIPLRTIPDVRPGDDLALLIFDACRREGVDLEDGDVVVVSSKVVSKSEGRIVDLDSVNPGADALELSRKVGIDPRLVQLILEEGDVLKIKRELIITYRRGIVCGNAGIDMSNVDGSGRRVVLLPEDPDRSAREIRRRLMELSGRKVAVIVVDTCGRPFRRGAVNFAIGIAGIRPFRTYVGRRDRYGYVMQRTNICIVDEIAAAAELAMGQGDEGIPVVIVRGVDYEECEDCTIMDVVMPREDWLFK